MGYFQMVKPSTWNHNYLTIVICFSYLLRYAFGVYTMLSICIEEELFSKGLKWNYSLKYF